MTGADFEQVVFTLVGVVVGLILLRGWRGRWGLVLLFAWGLPRVVVAQYADYPALVMYMMCDSDLINPAGTMNGTTLMLPMNMAPPAAWGTQSNGHYQNPFVYWTMPLIHFAGPPVGQTALGDVSGTTDYWYGSMWLYADGVRTGDSAKFEVITWTKDGSLKGAVKYAATGDDWKRVIIGGGPMHSTAGSNTPIGVVSLYEDGTNCDFNSRTYETPYGSGTFTAGCYSVFSQVPWSLVSNLDTTGAAGGSGSTPDQTDEPGNMPWLDQAKTALLGGGSGSPEAVAGTVSSVLSSTDLLGSGDIATHYAAFKNFFATPTGQQLDPDNFLPALTNGANAMFANSWGNLSTFAPSPWHSRLYIAFSSLWQVIVGPNGLIPICVGVVRTLTGAAVVYSAIPAFPTVFYWIRTVLTGIYVVWIMWKMMKWLMWALGGKPYAQPVVVVNQPLAIEVDDEDDEEGDNDEEEYRPAHLAADGGL